MFPVISAIGLILLLAAAPVSAQELPPSLASYTADSVVEVAGQRLVQKIYHDRGRERQEMNIDGLFQVTILRPDLDQAFVIQPGLDHYIELSIAEAALIPVPGPADGYAAEPLGEEREGGEPTVKFQLASTDGAEQFFDMLVWITDDGIVMRMEGEIAFEGVLEPVLLIRRNVQRAQQDAALFEPRLALATIIEENRVTVPQDHKGIGNTGP